MCAIDGVFSQDPDATLRYHRASTLSDSDIAAVEATTRARVLRLFEREGLLSNRPSRHDLLTTLLASPFQALVCYAF